MAEVRLPAETRTAFGKGAARRIRRDNKIPAVLYGHGTDPVHVTLPGHDTMMALKTPNVLLTLDIEGDQQLALPKHVQRDPLLGTIEHVDLLLVRRGEKVTVDVPVHPVGEPAPGTLLSVLHTTVSLEAPASAIPSAIEVSVSGLLDGAHVLARDLVLPEGASLQADPDTLIVAVSAVVEEAEEAAAEAGTAGPAETSAAEAAEHGTAQHA